MKTTSKNTALAATKPVAEAQSPAPDIDARELMLTMAKALCRQHIMWPTDGPLPCETGVDCDKQHLCSQMAKDVIDFTKELEADKET